MPLGCTLKFGKETNLYLPVEVLSSRTFHSLAQGMNYGVCVTNRFIYTLWQLIGTMGDAVCNCVLFLTDYSEQFHHGPISELLLN